MRIWVATINHDNGIDVRVALSEKDLLAEVYEYVKECWDAEGPIPKDHKEACEQYFDGYSGDEWHYDYHDVRRKKRK